MSPRAGDSQPVPGGFSLVEFLVAAFILAVGLLGLSALMTLSYARATDSRGRTTAAYLANRILEQIQAEGAYTYAAKCQGQALPTGFTALFTADPGTGKDEAAYGGFNVDGIQISGSDGKTFTNVASLVPDEGRRGKAFQATWLRQAYAATGALGLDASGPQTQEFIVNIAWNEQGQAKYLSTSRLIRY